MTLDEIQRTNIQVKYILKVDRPARHFCAPLSVQISSNFMSFESVTEETPELSLSE